LYGFYRFNYYPIKYVVAAHDRNYVHMKSLIRVARLAQNAVEHPVENDELLLCTSEVVAGPCWPAESVASSPAASLASVTPA
jgi:hypothetical protein